MKKSQLRQIIREEIEKELNQIQTPYFQNMEELGLTNTQKEAVLEKIFNQPISITSNYLGNNVYDDDRNKIYGEDKDGFWRKMQYNEKGRVIYLEDSEDGIWTNIQ